MAEPSETQLRLVYSLLKPAVKMAAEFHVPMRALTEALRLAYFEVLRREGLSQAAIAQRLGQSERHMRSLQRKLKTDFFAAETEVGLVREVENVLSEHPRSRKQLHERLKGWTPEECDAAIATLLGEERIVEDQGKLSVAPRYVLLTSEKFHHRIDALNHFLGGVTRAVSQRLLYDDSQQAMLKAISFTALPTQVPAFLRALEGRLRGEIAELEETASFEGQTGHRYTLGIVAAAEHDDSDDAG